MQNGNTINATRNTSVDTFRFLLMFLIVLHHCFIHGLWSNTESLWRIVFTVAIGWHVDGFAAISGWFGIQFSWRKWFDIVGIILFYSILSSIWALATAETIPTNPLDLGRLVHISGGWFGGTYLGMMLLSPIINTAIDGLSTQGRSHAIKAWKLFALCVLLGWLPLAILLGIGAAGVSAYSICTMVFVYFTARIIRIYCTRAQMMKIATYGSIAFFISMCCVALAVLASPHVLGASVSSLMLCSLSGYDAPYIWGFAVSMLLCFTNFIRIPQWIGNFCSKFSPAVFGIYLIHDTTSFGKSLHLITEKMLQPYLSPFIIIFIAAIPVFFIGLFADYVRHRAAKWMKAHFLIPWMEIRQKGSTFTPLRRQASSREQTTQTRL